MKPNGPNRYYPLNVAVLWAVNQINCAEDAVGFSPSHLVYGFYLLLPTVNTFKPILSHDGYNNIILEHLEVKKSARESFVRRAEISKLIRRKLNREYNENENCDTGDKIFYRTSDEIYNWRLPAKIISQDHKWVKNKAHSKSFQLCEANELHAASEDFDNCKQEIHSCTDRSVKSKPSIEQKLSHYTENSQKERYKSDDDESSENIHEVQSAETSKIELEDKKITNSDISSASTKTETHFGDTVLKIIFVMLNYIFLLGFSFILLYKQCFFTMFSGKLNQPNKLRLVFHKCYKCQQKHQRVHYKFGKRLYKLIFVFGDQQKLKVNQPECENKIFKRKDWHYSLRQKTRRKVELFQHNASHKPKEKKKGEVCECCFFLSTIWMVGLS